MTLQPSMPRHLFTGDQVMRMVEAGILSKNDKVELLEGDLIEMTPQGPPHASLTGELHDRLRQAYGDGFAIRSQSPLDCGPHSLPEPDVAVVRGAHTDYRQHHPRGVDAVLVVEVARTSHAIDRFKASVYARSGVPVYWLLDVPARRVEVYSEPKSDGSYALVTIVNPGDTLAPPGTSAIWTLDALLP